MFEDGKQLIDMVYLKIALGKVDKKMTFCGNEWYWLNEPKDYSVSEETVTINPATDTDFWEKTYYGFQSSNAPALLRKVKDKRFSYTVKTEFDSKNLFDQCGAFLYIDKENWVKASVEYEGDSGQKLGSVVTNLGFSDWATVDVSAKEQVMYYRVSRRESDIRLESSRDGKEFSQMRILHLLSDPEEIAIGIYACSPSKGGFTATFSEMEYGECIWELE